MAFGMDMGPDSVVNIKVIGVGGGGNNVCLLYTSDAADE